MRGLATALAAASMLGGAGGAPMRIYQHAPEPDHPRLALKGGRGRYRRWPNYAGRPGVASKGRTGAAARFAEQERRRRGN